MATLVLGAVGSAVGGALLPGGLSLFGAAISGAAIVGAVGSLAGGVIDQALLGPLAGPSGQTQIAQGPRLFDLKLGASSEGASIPRVYGRARLPGQLIWATRFKEVVKTTTQTTGGGQAGGGKNVLGSQSTSQSGNKVEIEEYLYFANAAYAICEGAITRVGRIWADGRELNQSRYTIRVYRGDEDQMVDPLIAAKEGGSDKAPAYRGIAYVVFDDLPLARFGNRLPQLNFEVFRAVDDFESRVRAVTMIPAAGEFIYDDDRVIHIAGGATIAENLHTALGGTDWKVSLDQLEEQLPNVADLVTKAPIIFGGLGLAALGVRSMPPRPLRRKQNNGGRLSVHATFMRAALGSGAMKLTGLNHVAGAQAGNHCSPCRRHLLGRSAHGAAGLRRMEQGRPDHRAEFAAPGQRDLSGGTEEDGWKNRQSVAVQCRRPVRL